MSKKDILKGQLQELGLPTHGTIKAMETRIASSQRSTQKEIENDMEVVTVVAETAVAEEAKVEVAVPSIEVIETVEEVVKETPKEVFPSPPVQVKVAQKSAVILEKSVTKQAFPVGQDRALIIKNAEKLMGTWRHLVVGKYFVGTKAEVKALRNAGVVE